MALPGFNPFGQLMVQFMIVWHRHNLYESLTSFSLSSVSLSLLSIIQRYACISTAGPRYLSPFHQYDGQEVEQHAHKIHSYNPSSFARSSLLWYSSPSLANIYETLWSKVLCTIYKETKMLSLNQFTNCPQPWWLFKARSLRSLKSHYSVYKDVRFLACLQERPDWFILRIEVAHINHKIPHHMHMRQWSYFRQL